MKRRIICLVVLLVLLTAPLAQATPPFALGADPKYLAVMPVVRIIDGLRLMNPDILSLAFADKIITGRGTDNSKWVIQNHNQFVRETANYMRGRRIEELTYDIVQIDDSHYKERGEVLIVLEMVITAHNPYRKTFNRYFIVTKPFGKSAQDWKTVLFILETLAVIDQ